MNFMKIGLHFLHQCKRPVKPFSDSLITICSTYRRFWVQLMDHTSLIKAPKHNKERYFNRKHFHSMNLLAVVGFDGRFLDISAGFPGSIHDARVLQMSGRGTKIPRDGVVRLRRRIQKACFSQPFC